MRENGKDISNVISHSRDRGDDGFHTISVDGRDIRGVPGATNPLLEVRVDILVLKRDVPDTPGSDCVFGS